MPVIETARVRVPMRRAEAGQSGHEVDAAGRIDLPRERLALGGVVQDARARRAATGSRHRSRGSRPRARSRRSLRPSPAGPRRRPAPVPACASTKLPVPYVAFASPRSKQPCPKSAACWSPAMPAIGSVAPSSFASPTTPDERTSRGSSARSTPNSVEQLVVPVERREVEQHRPRGVRQVGGVHAAPGQLPDEPRVDGAERELARRRRFAQAATRASSPKSTDRARAPSVRG